MPSVWPAYCYLSWNPSTDRNPGSAGSEGGSITLQVRHSNKSIFDKFHVLFCTKQTSQQQANIKKGKQYLFIFNDIKNKAPYSRAKKCTYAVRFPIIKSSVVKIISIHFLPMTNRPARQSDPSYELINPKTNGSILYRQHGFPHELVRWHYHKEYELHLITHSSGKVFVGDYIGNFYPGNLILTGPNLPHNWISHTDEQEEYPERDRVVVFTDDIVQSARQVMPEFEDLDDLLQRSRFGIQFTGRQTIERAHELMVKIANSDGLESLAHFLIFMDMLAKTDEYRLLSSENYFSLSGEKHQQRVNQAVNYIFDHYNGELSLEEVAAELGMQPAYFSRFFRQATGRRFVEFVNSLRINRACDRLAHSDMPITDICFDVGFTNISNFNRRFMALKEMTPSDYRRLAAVASSIA